MWRTKELVRGWAQGSSGVDLCARGRRDMMDNQTAFICCRPSRPCLWTTQRCFNSYGPKQQQHPTMWAYDTFTLLSSFYFHTYMFASWSISGRHSAAHGMGTDHRTDVRQWTPKSLGLLLLGLQAWSRRTTDGQTVPLDRSKATVMLWDHLDVDFASTCDGELILVDLTVCVGWYLDLTGYNTQHLSPQTYR